MTQGKPRSKPKEVSGIRHIFAAAFYSLAGARRLWRETAFRHIVLAGAVCLALFIGVGASWMELCVLAILFLALVAAEALNTAIECVVDHLAPDWQEFARDAKDLGSLATMCMLVAAGLYIVLVVLQNLAVL